MLEELISRLTTVAERKIPALLAATINAEDEVLDVASSFAALDNGSQILVEDIADHEVVVAGRDHIEKLRREKYDVSIPSNTREYVVYFRRFNLPISKRRK